jgi:hypothetical protein
MIRAFGEALPELLWIGLLVYCLIDCIQTPEASIRALQKPVWIILIILLPIIGGICWLFLGRPQGRREDRWSPGAGSHQPSHRPLAPDDDPAFLKQVDAGNKSHEAMLKQWEADLKRREQELRATDPADDGPKDPDAPEQP